MKRLIYFFLCHFLVAFIPPTFSLKNLLNQNQALALKILFRYFLLVNFLSVTKDQKVVENHRTIRLWKHVLLTICGILRDFRNFNLFLSIFKMFKNFQLYSSILKGAVGNHGAIRLWKYLITTVIFLTILSFIIYDL